MACCPNAWKRGGFRCPMASDLPKLCVICVPAPALAGPLARKGTSHNENGLVLSGLREGCDGRRVSGKKGVLGCRGTVSPPRGRPSPPGADGGTCRPRVPSAYTPPLPLPAVEPSQGARQSHVLDVVQGNVASQVARANRATHQLGHVGPPHAVDVPQKQRPPVPLAYGP